MWITSIIVYTSEVIFSMEEYLYDSLYFTVSKLHRNISRIADQEFKAINIPPSYAVLMMLLDEWKELTPSGISNSLDITPSTTTRFLDKLEKQKLIKRRIEGKFYYISLTSLGVSKIPEIKGIFEGLEYKLHRMVSTKVANKEKPILFDMAVNLKEKS